MTDYTELCENLRKYAEQAINNHDNYIAEDLREAADAIDQLQERNEHLMSDCKVSDGLLKRHREENERLKKQLDAAVDDICAILTDNAECCFPVKLCKYCWNNGDCGTFCNPKWRGEEDAE